MTFPQLLDGFRAGLTWWFLVHWEMSQKQMTSSMAVAGAILGAVLALFLLLIITIVFFSARKVPAPTHTDKVIDLPPTHKPPAQYSQRSPAVPPGPQLPHVAMFSQAHRTERRFEMPERAACRVTRHELQNPTHHPMSYQEWICHQNGADRVYTNHREQYV